MIQVRRILKDNIRIFLIGGLFLSTYLIFSIFIFDKDPVIYIVSRILDFYLLLVEKLSSLIIAISGSEAGILQNQVVHDNTGIREYISLLRYKKIPVVALLLIWLTRTETRDKIWFTIIYILLHLVVLSSYYAVEAHSLTVVEDNAYLIVKSHHLISVLLLVSVFFAWYTLKKEDIALTFKKLSINNRLFEGNVMPVFIAIWLFIIIDNFPVELNSYLPWINIIFTSAQKILGIVGFDATIDQFSLIGENGSIMMRKGCLGIGAMFLFASIVYLTGRNNAVKWIYMVAGVIFLNIVNVVRFVFLFMYIQNHEIDATMDVHATYSYITYTVIFLMWILWFEKFSDMKTSTSINRRGGET